jgi:3-keto-L-gulonate-6-phosphate decarboxylase
MTKDLTNWKEEFQTLITKDTDFLHTNGDSLMLDDNIKDLEKIKQFIKDLLKEAYEDGLNTDLYEKAKKERDKEWLSILDKYIAIHTELDGQIVGEDNHHAEVVRIINLMKENATQKGLIK